MERSSHIKRPLYRDPKFWLVLLFAAALRMIYIAQVRDEAWFLAPGTDPEFYLRWSTAILNGDGGQFLPYPRAPLYPYLLAGIRGSLGDWWGWPRLFNLGCELITLSLVMAVARSVLGFSAAYLAGILYALCGAAIYFSGEILMTSLATMLAAGFAYTLAAALASRRAVHWAAVGLVCGLWALLRPNAALLAPAAIVAAGVGVKFGWTSLRKAAVNTIALTAVFILVISPATAINYIHSRQFIPIALQGGVNFYIGSVRGATGWASVLPGAGAAWTEIDAARISSAHAGGALSPAQESSEFAAMALAEIRAAPADYLKLTLKKIALLVNVREIGNNRPLSLAREASGLIRLAFIISLGSLLPFALWGLWSTGRSPHKTASLTVLVAYSLSLLPFFITARYRMPLLPLSAVWAAVGIVGTVQLRGASLTKALAFIAVIAGLTLPNLTGDNFDQPAQARFVNGNAMMRLGWHQQAIEAYAEAARIDPAFPDLHLNWGAALMELGEFAEAKVQFERATRRQPGSYRAWNNLGAAAERLGKYDDAESCYRRAFAIEKRFDDARLNLARALLRRGDESVGNKNPREASALYSEAAELSPNDPRPCHRIAILMIQLEKFSEARAWASEALRRDSSYRPAREVISRLERFERE